MSKLIQWSELPPEARYSKPHLRRLEHNNQFPKRVQLSPLRVAWVEDEVKAWLTARIAARDKAATKTAA
jgi:prophage regulatory protein